MILIVATGSKAHPKEEGGIQQAIYKPNRQVVRERPKKIKLNNADSCV